MRALFVDDEREFLELMEKRLSRRGIEVSTAHDGLEGVRAVEEAAAAGTLPDVVVMDVRMPGMDGLEALRRMKAVAATLPVVLLTGHASLGVAVEGMDLGAFDYLLKPVAINELILNMAVAAPAAG